MTIASTGFMAAPGAFGSALLTKLDKIDCSQVLAAVLKADKALLGHIKMGATAHNIQCDWIEDALNECCVYGTSGTSASATIQGFAATASMRRIIREGAVLCPADNIDDYGPGGSSFLIYVTSTAVAQPSLLATASYGGTTWLSITATMKWYVIANPHGDSSDATDDISLVRDKRKNFMQVFERAVEITQSRKGMDMEAVANELQLQIKRRTLEIKRELDMSVIHGMAREVGGVLSADHDMRTMQGIVNLIRDPDLDQTRNDATVTACAGALTIGDVNDLLKKIWDEGGLDEGSDPIIVVGADQQRVIAGWESEIRRVEQGERQVGYYRDIFLSDMGTELPIVLDRWMKRSELLVLDRSRVAIRGLRGDSWHMEKMAKTGRHEKWQISGQYTIELRNAGQCHGLLHDIS